LRAKLAAGPAQQQVRPLAGPMASAGRTWRACLRRAYLLRGAASGGGRDGGPQPARLPYGAHCGQAGRASATAWA